MSDPTRSLRAASFRGVPFHVSTEDLAGGGRNAISHEFVRSDVVLSEDMGRKTKRYRVKGYTVGEMSSAECQALVAACGAAGPGILVLPMQGSLQVLCCECGLSRDKDKLGFVEITMEFIEANDGASFPSFSLGDRIAIEALNGLAGLASGVVSAFGAR